MLLQHRDSFAHSDLQVTSTKLQAYISSMANFQMPHMTIRALFRSTNLRTPEVTVNPHHNSLKKKVSYLASLTTAVHKCLMKEHLVRYLFRYWPWNWQLKYRWLGSKRSRNQSHIVAVQRRRRMHGQYVHGWPQLDQNLFLSKLWWGLTVTSCVRQLVDQKRALIVVCGIWKFAID